MKMVIRGARQWSLAALVAASLGFGATQVVAAPAEAAEAQTCLKYQCMTYCQSRGGTGECVYGTCFCKVPVQ
jgi:hypothetical protein